MSIAVLAGGPFDGLEVEIDEAVPALAFTVSAAELAGPAEPQLIGRRVAAAIYRWEGRFPGRLDHHLYEWNETRT